MDAILRGLNAAQRAAVTSPASVLQVLAPPGSGKTKTLTSRVAYLLVNHGYAPWNIICCTFTIKASNEMRERLRGIVGEQEAKLLLGTFHSICRRYLVRYGHLINLPKNFGIADSSDSLAIIKRAVKRLNLSIDPKVARSRISHKKARGHRLEDLPKMTKKTVEAQEFMTVFTEYENALSTSKLLDYDDLLLRCSDLLRQHPECVSNVEALLIDEFQDTNVVQFELMKLLASARRRITVVGDPDQSIYGFRSAEIENLHRMRVFYPETTTINLEENYRSSSAVLKLAQDVIEQDTDRPDKKLKSTHCYGTLPVLRRLPNAHEEALWIVSEIKRMLHTTGGLLQYSDIAILLRSAFLSLLIEKALAKEAMPYRMVGGHRFFDRVEIRILLGYLRTISQPDNSPSLLAIINVPSRKVGETTIKELLHVSEQNKLSLWSALQKVLSGDLDLKKKLSKPSEQSLRRLVALIKDARKKVTALEPNSVPKELLEFVISNLGFKDYLKAKYQEDHEDRWENVQELLTQAADSATENGINLAAQEELPEIEGLERQSTAAGEEVLARFLANIVLSTEAEASEEGKHQPRVTVSTIHSAKGLEWPVVFVPATYEGSIPHSRAEDTNEERRLLYVAMTRAQALLILSFPLFQSRDQSESILSQFLPSQVLHRFAETGPDFNDKVIGDVATILRRSIPSQEDLVGSRNNISDLESPLDDIWPADGSRRPTRMWDQEPAEATYTLAPDEYPESCKNGPERLRSTTSPPKVQSFGMGDFTSARRHMSTVRTTMNGHQAFSTAYSSVSYTRSLLEFQQTIAKSSNEAAEKCSTSHPSTATRIKNGSRSDKTEVDPRQGSLSAFFSQRSSKPTPVTDKVVRTQLCSNPSFKSAEPDVSAMAQASLARQIPEHLSDHSISTKPLSTKRSRPVLDETDIHSKKRYAFLSSSPNRHVESGPSDFGVDENAVGNTDMLDIAKATNGGVTTSKDTSASYHAGLYRPASTLHNTSISQLHSTGPGRRTLGVRRTMNGWENRLHK